jgi:hypothetical protein
MKKLNTIAFVLLALAAAPRSLAQMHQRYPAASDATLTAQAASVGTTNIVGAAPAGIYNVCWVQQITQAATVSSSLIATIGWNNGSAKTTVLFSLNGGALQLTADVTNVLNSTGGNCILVYSAAGQPITYATTYASVGATPMQYGLFITAERLQ